MRTVVEIADGVRSGALSARDMVGEAFAAIEAKNPELNAFIMLDRERAEREADAIEEMSHDRVLVGGADVSQVIARFGMISEQILEFGLESGEAETEIGLLRDAAREDEFPDVALLGVLLDERAARVGQTEELRAFVEGFAGGIVDRAGDDREAELFV